MTNSKYSYSIYRGQIIPVQNKIWCIEAGASQQALYKYIRCMAIKHGCCRPLAYFHGKVQSITVRVFIIL